MIAIIKYNAGNVKSILNSIKKLGYKAILTDDHNIIKKSKKVIFPGVGEASSAMKYLKNKNLDILLSSLKQPVFGICLGLQLMCKYSEEGHVECLNIFDAKVKKFPKKNIIPHIGWNNFIKIKNKLFNNITIHDDVYYVHSYYVELNKYTIGESEYIVPFSAALQKNNFYAVQFHPEKSGAIGEKILKNFLEI